MIPDALHRDAARRDAAHGNQTTRRVVIPMMATIAVGAVDMQLVTPLTALLARAFKTTPDAVGWLVSAYALASALATPLLAPLVVRHGAIASLRAGLLLLAVGNAFAALSPGLLGLAVARAACGVGGGLAMTLCHVHVLQVLPREERAGAIGWLTAGFFLATIVFIPLNTVLADRISWRLSFAVTAAAIAVCAWFVRRVPEGARGGVFALRDYAPLLATRGVPWGLLTYFGYGAGFTASATYLAPWVESRFGVSTSIVGLIFLASGVAAFFSAPLAGRASDRFGRRPIAFLSNTIMAALFVALPHIGSLAAAAVAYALCSPLASWRFTATMAALGELVPATRRGPLLLVNNTAILTGMATGAAVGGWLFARGGYAATGLGAGIVTIVAGLSLLGLRPARALPPPLEDLADAHEPPPDDAGILPG